MEKNSECSGCYVDFETDPGDLPDGFRKPYVFCNLVFKLRQKYEDVIDWDNATDEKAHSFCPYASLLKYKYGESYLCDALLCNNKELWRKAVDKKLETWRHNLASLEKLQKDLDCELRCAKG